MHIIDRERGRKLNDFEWLTTVEIEQKYGLPKGSVRRDIHRGKFKPGQEIYKKGRDWLVSAAAAEKLYKKQSNPQE
jgi:hypothetical protein